MSAVRTLHTLICNLNILICKLKVILHLFHYALMRMRGEAETSLGKLRQQGLIEQGLKQQTQVKIPNLISTVWSCWVSVSPSPNWAWSHLPQWGTAGSGKSDTTHCLHPWEVSSKCLYSVPYCTCVLILFTSISSHSLSSRLSISSPNNDHFTQFHVPDIGSIASHYELI